jgi:Transposase DDE domain
MEHQLFTEIMTALAGLDQPPTDPRQRYTPADIVRVWYWAVIHDRPVSWACRAESWPGYLRRRPLPSSSTLSRRLRTPAVRDLLAALERRVTAPKEPGLYWMLDGKPLVIGGCSKDRQAGYGRAAGGKAKGYKVHALVGADGALAAWRLAPMNKDERVMAARLLRTAPVQGYVVADSNYDSNPLHAVCDARGDVQLVTRRRYGPGRGHGHRRQTPGRRRSIAITESPDGRFGAALLGQRSEIERRFGHLTNWGGGLTCLPPWARTHRRVHRWVQAKLVLTALKRRLGTPTCVA